MLQVDLSRSNVMNLINVRNSNMGSQVGESCNAGAREGERQEVTTANVRECLCTPAGDFPVCTCSFPAYRSDGCPSM